MSADLVLQQVLAKDAPTGGTRILAIDGPSGSGKSTLAHEVADLAGAPIVAMDYLYDGWDGLEAGVDLLVEGVLTPLAEGKPGHHPKYDWYADAYGDVVEVPVAPLVIVEGVGSGALRCAPFTTLLVWVEAPDEVRLTRAVERDGVHQTDKLVAWQDLEAEHFAREDTRRRADVVLDG